ncbi:Protein T10E10.4 [Aphelenchoides avenae]|nr:Protein T10E10.4 [Aphelenchus avenae]
MERAECMPTHECSLRNVSSSFRKLWPGEYGCSTDLECASRCPNTYCEAKSDKGVPQCQCKNGLLLYGRCFSKCPPGFHESGAYCQHDDEETFWSNADAQDVLQKLLNNGPC